MAFDLLSCMQSFVTIAKCQGFAKAANKLYLAPSVLTKQIQKLEQHVGKTLFTRTTRTVELTEAGLIYLNLAENILRQIQQATDTLNDIEIEPHGLLKVGISGIFDYEPCSHVLHKFLVTYPKLQLEVSNQSTPYNLIDKRFDITISDIDINDEKFNRDYLCTIERCVFAAPSYIKKYGKPKSIDDLKNHNCLIYLGVTPTHEWVFNNKKVKVSGNYFSNSSSNIIAMAVSGLGLIWASKPNISEYIKAGQLVEIKLDNINAARKVWIYSLSTHNPNVRLFHKYLKDEFTKLNVPYLSQSKRCSS